MPNKQVVNLLYIYLYNGVGVLELIRGIYAREKTHWVIVFADSVVVGGGGLLLAQKALHKTSEPHFAFPATR